MLLEPIQGETGIHVLSDELLEAARGACDRVGAALVFDEIQTGMGRTGTLWAYEQTDVVPDAITSAKALGGGLPIGALVTGPRLADVLQAGDHGSTFAGGPLVCSAALAALEICSDPELLARVRVLGERLAAGLASLPYATRGPRAGADASRSTSPRASPPPIWHAARCSSSGWSSTRPARRRSASSRRSSSPRRRSTRRSRAFRAWRDEQL